MLHILCYILALCYVHLPNTPNDILLQDDLLYQIQVLSFGLKGRCFVWTPVTRVGTESCYLGPEHSGDYYPALFTGESVLIAFCNRHNG